MGLRHTPKVLIEGLIWESKNGPLFSAVGFVQL